MRNNKGNKFVSIIIPSRNEERYIESCLDSFLNQDYPKNKIEILVVDGNSKDNTREIVKRYSKKNKNIKLIENDKEYTPFALNLGIKNSKGDIILRADAHAEYSNDYVSMCVKYLEEYKADNVGGVLISIPKEEGLVATGICLSLSSIFGAGNSAFRVGVEEAREVDTVFGGCYRREVFEKIGLFNENLIRSQDIEFNMRLRKAGGKILLVPEIVAYYYPKDNLLDFFIHNFKDGFWSIYPLKFIKMPLKLRHYIPLIFVVSLFVSFLFTLLNSILFTFLFQLIVFLYVLFTSYFSFKIVLKEKKFDYFAIMFLVFFTRHFGYGLGSIWGVIVLIKEKFKK